MRKVKFLIVGGCLTQLAADALRQLAPGFGIDAFTEEAFSGLIESVLMEEPNVVIFQPSTATFLERLWDHAAFLDDEARGLRLEVLKQELGLSLAKVRARAQGALFLVHGFVTPLFSPLGRTEFRNTYNFRHIVHELNQVIIDAIGLHQALKVAKQRGVLLAICSRNHEEDVHKAWGQLKTLSSSFGAIHLLQPEDFVMQRINWEPKSANIAEIMSALGLSPSSVIFVDDSPIERAEVQAAYPTMRVMGDNMSLVRSTLLDDPCLQNNLPTAESAARTEMVKGQLLRDAAKAESRDELAFLQQLHVRLKVLRLRGRTRLARAVELIQRTNQFNTTLLRLDADELSKYIESSRSAIYVLEASDRFTSYGLVGVCVLREEEILSLVMSCRIIPLRAEVPFLTTALTHYGLAPMRGKIVEGPRNQPSRHVFRDAQFDEVAAGIYCLPSVSRLPRVNHAIYSVEYLDESDPTTDVGAVANG